MGDHQHRRALLPELLEEVEDIAAGGEVGRVDRDTSGGRATQESMTTTSISFDGYGITANHDVVRGITVRSRSIFGTIGASIQTLSGGDITLFSELSQKTRADAFDMMLAHAEECGANAVVGIRYDATEVMRSESEVLCLWHGGHGCPKGRLTNRGCRRDCGRGSALRG